MIETDKDTNYVLCINNEGYPTSLERLKLYRILPDGEPDLGLVRIIDESGEDYLYEASRFIPAAIDKDRLQAIGLSEEELLEVAVAHSQARALPEQIDLAVLQEYARKLQELGRELRLTLDAREAARISQEIYELTRNMEIASRAQEQAEEHEENLDEAD